MYRVCFIDDDKDFEISLFQHVFSNVYDVIAADSYDAARRHIAEHTDWRPDLFVLDLYFPSGPPDRDATAGLRESDVTFAADRGEIRAAYTNFATAKKRLGEVLRAWRQGPAGGLEVARRVMADYPRVPVVFYSRKATFDDALRCLALDNVWWIEKKPTGFNDDDTQRRTLAARADIARRFDAVIAGEYDDSLRALKRHAAPMQQLVSYMLGEDG